MPGHLQEREALPDEVTRQLEDMLYGVPASTAAYLFGMAFIPVALWWRSHDILITAIAAFAVIVNASRVAIVFWFKRHQLDGDGRQPALYWTLISWVGCLYSLVMAALAVRAFVLGEPLIIAVAVIAVAGYVTGLVIRASAVPRLTVPQILMVFIPMIVASSVVADRAYLMAGFLLCMFCTACIQLSRTVYQRMKAQLIAEHRLSQLSRIDYLTGLFNRACFDAHGSAQHQEARAGRSGFALALIDLDGFKGVNDAHGHAAGDELLKEVSRRFRSVLNGHHFAARLGGDEFAIVFDPDFGVADAQAIGDDIVRVLKRPFDVADTIVQISGSLGLATFETTADSFASIVARADQALYRAKKAGRNQALLSSIASPGLAPRLAEIAAQV